MIATIQCSGCLRPVYPWADPCLACVRARHRAAVTHRCSCPKHLRRESGIKRAWSRTWISCERCLGTVRQLS